jgi:hypothetical protein
MTKIAPPQHTPNACRLVRMTSGELAFVNIRFDWKPVVEDPEGRDLQNDPLSGLQARSKTAEME